MYCCANAIKSQRYDVESRKIGYNLKTVENTQRRTSIIPSCSVPTGFPKLESEEVEHIPRVLECLSPSIATLPSVKREVPPKGLI